MVPLNAQSLALARTGAIPIGEAIRTAAGLQGPAAKAIGNYSGSIAAIGASYWPPNAIGA